MPETVEAVLDRPHDRVVGIVEIVEVGQDLLELLAVGLGRMDWPQQATDLGRDQERVPVLPSERIAQPMLGQPVAVLRRRVEQADA